MKTKSNCPTRMVSIALLFLWMGLAGCFKSTTQQTILYENDFESKGQESLGIGGWNSTQTAFGPISDNRVASYNGTKILTHLNNNSILLSFKNIVKHNAIRVAFDLYLINQWNNDLWAMDFDGKQQLITGFSNNASIPQAYPNWLNSGPTTPAGSNSMSNQLMGTCGFSNQLGKGSVYRIVRTIKHSAANFSLHCSDAGGTPNDVCTRHWGIDNIEITAINN